MLLLRFLTDTQWSIVLATQFYEIIEIFAHTPGMPGLSSPRVRLGRCPVRSRPATSTDNHGKQAGKSRQRTDPLVYISYCLSSARQVFILKVEATTSAPADDSASIRLRVFAQAITPSACL